MVDCGTITVEAESEFDESLVDISCDIQTPEIDPGETAVVDIVLENNNDVPAVFTGYLTINGERETPLNPSASEDESTTETIEIDGLEAGVEYEIDIDVEDVQEA